MSLTILKAILAEFRYYSGTRGAARCYELIL